MEPTTTITAETISILIMIANATTTQTRDTAWIGNKQIRRPNFTECCKQLVMEIKKGDTLKHCDPTCVDCIRSKEKDGNQEVFNMSLCTGLGCSKMRWCGLDNNYKRYDCSRCKDHLKRACNITRNTECEQRTKRDNTHNSNNQYQKSSSSASHKKKSSNDKEFTDATNTLESAFFSLSSAIKHGRTKLMDIQETELDLDSQAIIEIVQSTAGIGLLIALIIALYKLRNRFNRLVRRTLPKGKFPPPLPSFTNGQNMTSAQHFTYNQPQQSHPPTQSSMVQFHPSIIANQLAGTSSMKEDIGNART